MEEKDLARRLKEYSESAYYPFHMPGHKRRAGEEFADDFFNPFSIDITEIDGFDNLHRPEGILRDAMETAAGIYGADKTYYLVGGSTCGILSAVCGTTSWGGTVLMARNCHKSAYHAVFLNRLKTAYVYPQVIPEFGIQGGLIPPEIEKMLKSRREIQAVLMVSPTYEGIVSDIRTIAQIAHEYGKPLIVDEAHGAHFPFGERFPVSALELGADVVIQSLHKTLPSFTQTAVLHLKKGFVDVERIERFLGIFQSSSPSYLLMAGIDRCIRRMDREGRRQMEEFYIRIKGLRGRLGKMERLTLLPESLRGQYGIYDMDPGKVVISARRAGMSGARLMELLRRDYLLELEMSGADYVTAIASPADTEAGLRRLEEALLAIDRECGGRALPETRRAGSPENCGAGETALSGLPGNPQGSDPVTEPEIRLTISAALDMPRCLAPLEESRGRVSAEFICPYPPGIPAAAPGELLGGELVNRIKSCLESGLLVQGVGEGPDFMVSVIEE